MEEKWFLLGDIHGDARPIQRFYERNKDILSLDAEQNHIILLGDVGANFQLHGQRDDFFKKRCQNIPSPISACGATMRRERRI